MTQAVNASSSRADNLTIARMSEPTRFPTANAPARAPSPVSSAPPATGFSGATGAPFASTEQPGFASRGTSSVRGQPPAAAAAILPPRTALGPQYTLEEGKHERRLRIGEWEVMSTKRPILNGKEIDA